MSTVARHRHRLDLLTLAPSPFVGLPFATCSREMLAIGLIMVGLSV